MSWQERLRAASFRGVPFFVDNVESKFGRRSVLHEYPLRDKPFVEDLGRKARAFTVEAIILATPRTGNDYMGARDALIDAIEKPGPGLLVHPYLGELRVSITEAGLKESTAEGGKATFTLTCIETGEEQFPQVLANTQSLVGARADTAVAAINNDFASRFKVNLLPSFISTAADGLLGSALTSMQDLTSITPTLPATVADFLPQISTASANLTALLRTPVTLATTFSGLIGGLRSLVEAPADALKMLGTLFSFGSAGTSTAVTAIAATTPSRAQQGINQDAITDLIQRTAVVEGARAASEIAFTDFTGASAVRDQLCDALDGLMENAIDDATFNALADLRAAVVQDIGARGADLARVVGFTPKATLPALVVAHILYGDATRADEIVARNHIRNPGFVPGGQPLEVLADA